MIKILIVDDSAVIRSFLKKVINLDERFELVGEVEDGEKAIEACAALHPDLVIMDITMPVMDGITATKLIKRQSIPPIIVVFSTADMSSLGYKAIGAGAIEVIKKPEMLDMDSTFFKRFCDKLAAIGQRKKKSVDVNAVSMQPRSKSYKVLLIGASTGGPIAVQRVLKEIGSPFPLPILITQHIDKTFDKNFARWLSDTTGTSVVIPEENAKLENGVAYLAPAGKHMVLNPNGTIHLSDTERVHFLKPAVDPMFISAAKVFGEKAMAVLLTGMGNDGAEGCVEIKKAGGYTIAEAASSCVVFGMPKAAIMAGGATAILPLEKIGEFVKNNC